MDRLVIPVFRIVPLVLLVVGVAEELTSHHISIGFLVFWIVFFLVFMRVASARIKSMEDRWRLWKRSGIRVDHTPCIAGELVPFRFVLRAPVEIRGYSVELVARSCSFDPERKAKGGPDEEKDDENANPKIPTESVVEHIVQPIETKRLPVRPGRGLIAEGEIPIPEGVRGTGLQDYEEWEWGIRVWVEAAPPGAEASGPEHIAKPVAAFFPLEVTAASDDATNPLGASARIAGAAINPAGEKVSGSAESNGGTIAASEPLESALLEESPREPKPLLQLLAYPLIVGTLLAVLPITVSVVRALVQGGPALPKAALLFAFEAFLFGGWIGFVVAMLMRRPRSTRGDMLVGLVSALGWTLAASILWYLSTGQQPDHWVLYGSGILGLVWGVGGRGLRENWRRSQEHKNNPEQERTEGVEKDYESTEGKPVESRESPIGRNGKEDGQS